MERHGVRTFLIARELPPATLPRDDEILLCAALLHDLGAREGVASGDAYVRDSRRLAAEVLAPFGWPELRLERCLDAIEHHHRLPPQWTRGVEVELLRRADLVEGTGGLLAFGFPRRRLRALFRAVPRDGFYPMFARLGVRMLRERPSTIPAVFAP